MGRKKQSCCEFEQSLLKEEMRFHDGMASAEWLRQMRDRNPQEKYFIPVTEAQEIGWE